MFTACTPNIEDNETIPFNVGLNDHYGPKLSGFNFEDIDIKDERSKYFLTEKTDSLEDLIKLCDEKEYSFFNENDDNYDHELSQKVREYNDTFFQRNSLIMVFYYENTGDYPTKIDSLNIEDNVITVKIAKPGLEAVNCIASWYVYLIEVNKEDIKDVDKVEATHIIKGKIEDYN